MSRRVLNIIIGGIFSLNLLVIMLIIFMALSGCKTTRHTKTELHTTAVKAAKVDSVNQKQKALVKTEDKVHASHSDVQGVTVEPGKKAELKVTPTQLQPVTDAKGKKQGRTFRVDKDGMHLQVQVDKKGGIKVTGHTDSVLRPGNRVITDSYMAWALRDSVLSDRALEFHSEIKDSVAVSSTAETKVVKKGAGGWVILVAACILFTIVLIIRKRLHV